ncbi:hypothetical protein WMY93_024436 [Mugilogobius chulae]|uniref:Exonuclease domain-containing protein n=1 Tax=Mugilogobius chulae TaxID=88201 RepID=A0AAW0NC70_9GOBI
MLRSTGFFRGIDCPFYTDYGDGKGGKNGCNRPYCHFRHSSHRLLSYGAAENKKKELPAAQKEQGYDPFNPEVVHPPEPQNEPEAPAGDINGALALVNRAIEEVRNQMEREKRKLSRIGDEPYDPSENASLESTKAKTSVSNMTYNPSENASTECAKSKVSVSNTAYNPSQSASLESTKSKVLVSHMTYDPGSYQMTSEEYNPSPGCSKYTLDTNTQEKSANSMEYVPTSMKKSTSRTQKLLSSPPSPKYSNSTSSSKSKYTLDNTKPTTDMEYDPLSNYSASIAGKSKKKKLWGKFFDEYKPTLISNLQLKKDSSETNVVENVKEARTECFQTALTQRNKEEVTDLSKPDHVKNKSSLEKRKSDNAKAEKNYSASIAGKSKKEETVSVKSSGNKSSRIPSSTEEYVVSVKKPPQASVDSKKYTISDSDGESSSTEYKPTLISNLQLKKDISETDANVVENVKEARTECVQTALTQRNKEEVTDLSKPDNVKHKSSLEKRKSDNAKAEKKAVKEVSKSNTTCSSKSSSGIEKTKSSHSTSKKENKSNGKKEGEKSRDKIKVSSGKEERRSDSKVKSADKIKTDQSNKRRRDSESGGSESKKAKISDKEKSRHHKNGKLDSGKSPKALRIEGKTSSSSSSTSKESSKDKIQSNSSSPRSLKKSVRKECSLSLSHADLFGDESPEEAEPLDNNDDDDEEEMVVRKCAEAVKRRLNKRKASELTPSSSEDESDSTAPVNSQTAKEDVESLGIDLSSLQDDLDFETDPLEECLRIFNESNDVKKEDKGRQAKQVEAPPKAVVHPYKRMTAQEMCYQRIQLAQQQAAQLSAAVKKVSQSHSPSVSGEKKRIAHRPNPQITNNKTGAVKAKPNTSRVLSPSQSQPSVKTQTTAGILSKTSTTAMQKRVAHTPTLKSATMKRPVIPTEFGAKVPTNVRQRYLNTFIDECVKFCTSEQAAFQMALDEEKVVYERSSSKNIYLNVAVNTLKKLRSKSSTSPSPASRATLYHKLKTYLMTEEQLQEHGYPRKDPEASGKASSFNKICCRCGAEYMVNASGNCVRREECNYHWGRLRRQKVSGGWETSYSCCSGAVGSTGCQVAKQHVQDNRKESLDGFVSTFSKSLPVDGNAGVFALDCEMCYTKQGLELTRVTVINSELKVIYDTFVKPASKVVDYNTRFSGVTEEDLENVSITLRDVQAVLLSMFSAESILLGHSLESDLLALKLIHSNVVDTAIVFPHRLGLPYKRALRNLMSDHLKRIIQDSVGGHDSSEDASACMELMIWKIKEDGKVKR